MNVFRGRSTAVRRAGTSGLLRFGLCALLVTQKAVLGLVLIQASLEGGGLLESIEHVPKFAEATRDDRHHVPVPLANAVSPRAPRTSLAIADTISHSSSHDPAGPSCPRPPPAF